MPILASDRDFERLKLCLEQSGYTEAELCRHYGIQSLAQFEIEIDREQVVPFEEDSAGILLRLFVDGHYVPLALAEGRFGFDVLNSMVALGLLETHPDDPGQIASTVSLYPTAGLHLISDRWNHPDRSSYRPAPDVVYPALVANAQRFLRFMPDGPCESLLDVCAGSGAAAILAAKVFAKQAVATDIAERSVLFAEFNRRLNGLPNVENIQGDLYAPAAGRQFDRIVVHPPYVPVLRPKYIYHDGGDDGEHIVRRAVTEMPEYLAPGGLFYLMAMVSDREDEPFEQRVRRWLGDSGSEMDVAVFPMHSLEPDDFASRAVLSNPTPLDDYRAFRTLFRRYRIRQLVYVVLLIQRRTKVRSTFTIRRQAALESEPEALVDAIQWETGLRQEGALSSLLDARLRANEDTRLNVPHALNSEGWAPSGYVLTVSRPFSMEARIDPWVPHLLAFSDGTRTVRENLTLMIQQEILPEGVPQNEFAQAVSVLVSGGFLQVES